MNITLEQAEWMIAATKKKAAAISNLYQTDNINVYNSSNKTNGSEI